ncbi:MAG: NADH-dependent [FeFe] hydrogenase, group A6 [Oscillospiraceae bacterium]|nr:NADH-dependent [FeFe] hydrogenase, group A6 [Oscillospiraceae bacterium]
MDNITIKLNGRAVSVPAGSTILEAARSAAIDIPTLCYMKGLNEIGACRICVVEVKGAKSLITACNYPVSPNMEVFTRTPRVLEARKKTLQLLLSNHNCDCLSCNRNGTCELQALCRQYGVDAVDRYAGAKTPSQPDETAPHMIRDNSKCILCHRCVAVCTQVQSIGAIGANGRGFNTNVSSPFKLGLGTTNCCHCGQCIAVCPTGALTEKSQIDQVFDAINDPGKVVLVQTAPAVRASLGEAFGLPIGTDVQGKLAAALRRLGFDRVFDTSFGADLNVMEAAAELLARLHDGGKLPVISACCPSWVKFCEHFYPEMTEHLSTCKSPQQMTGAVAKSCWAEKVGIDPQRIVMVSIMPCTAKKFEIHRPDEAANGMPDVDYALTTRELARMIRRAGIRFCDLAGEAYDTPIRAGTGAGMLFGAAGGIAEATLRMAAYTLTGQPAPAADFSQVRGLDGVRQATYTLGEQQLKVAVASGLGSARALMEQVKSGKADYQFIEIMGCPGGCVNGGGQPQVPYTIRNFTDVREARTAVLYAIDKGNPLRNSYENPDVKALYKNYLSKPGSYRAHSLLHTTYIKRRRNEY